jgi:histidinol phosphatase-like PHP family hydrolase
MKLYPQVALLGKETTFTLELKSSMHIASIVIYSKNDYFHKEILDFFIDNYRVYFHFKPNQRGEHILKVSYATSHIESFEFFCVDEILHGLKPLKGDLHMHTTFSDGNRSPLAMALASIEKGMDFLAITDHDNYAGYQNALQKVVQNELDIILIPGEEVSVGIGDTKLSKGNGHMLSLNAKEGVHEMRQDREIYENELQKIASNLKDLDENIDPLHYARNIWAIRAIKNAGGVAVLCHPNWIYYDKKYHLHQPIFKQMLKEKLIDGIEVFGDVDGLDECNTLSQLELLNQCKMDDFFLLGNSDSHDSDVGIGERFSIIFASEHSNDGVVNSLKDKKCVAVQKRIEGNFGLLGTPEFAHYANFLLKNYFPQHDNYRNRLAKLYSDSILNQEDLSSKITAQVSKLDNYKNQFFG